LTVEKSAVFYYYIYMQRKRERAGQPDREPKTSWGSHARWYSKVVEERGSYQKEVILPGVLGLLDLKSGEDVLDLACGEGFFSREFHDRGANVLGVDAGAGLIDIAKKKSSKDIIYKVADARNLSFINDGAFGAAVIILALQNIDDINSVFKEMKRVLKKAGRMVLVLNHPVLRIPKFSGWGWDEGQSLQYRKINRYMTELKVPIEMHPGENKKEITWSFHRPLQSYFKALKGAGFVICDVSEWVSHKKSQRGPKANAEDLAREEFPLFMAIKAIAL